MNAQSQIDSQPALLAAPKKPAPPAAEALVAIAREHGVSPLRQLREMAVLRFGPGRLAPHEYVSTGAFRPDIAMAQKKELVGLVGSWALNTAANPTALTVSRGFIRDKVLYTQLLDTLGLPVAQTQALVHPVRSLGAQPVLRNRAEIVEFLMHGAVYPLFGKPVEGSGSVGSIRLEAAGEECVTLSTGRKVDASGFADEILHAFPEGYIFQTALVPHSDLRKRTGPAIGCLRLVTLRDAQGIAPLYAVWKLPAPRAMSDNFWQDGSMLAQVDADGRTRRVVRGSGLSFEEITRHPVSEADLIGVQMPHWPQTLELTAKAHAIFPEFGCIGWDIALTEDGPVIIEANANSFHALYQLAFGQGARGPQLLPRFEAAAEESARLLKSRVETHKAREKAKR